MQNIIFTFCLLLTAATTCAQGEENPHKLALKIITLNGSMQQLKSTDEQLLKMIPKNKHHEFRSDFEKLLPDVYDKFASMYVKMYTQAELESMLSFYESPAGRKITANVEELTRRSQAVTDEWMIKLQAVINKYKLP